jgi:hypothetical protein
MAERENGAARMDELKRIDAAIARDIERRARRRRIYWALLATIALVAAMVIMLGVPQTVQVARAITRTPELREVLANDVAQAPQVERVIRDAAQQAVTAATGPEAVAALVRSPAFVEPVEASARAAVRNYIDGDAFARMVAERPLPGSSESLSAKLDRISAGLDQQRDGLAAVTHRLDALSGPGDRAEVDRLSARVRELSAALARQQADLARVDGSGPTTYLLKERDATALPGMGLSVELGRRTDEGVENVRIDSPEFGRLFPPQTAAGHGGASVRFGDALEFDDPAGDHYRVVFPNAQYRLLARDFVMLNIAKRSPRTR